MDKLKNINFVAAHLLCSGCGACSGICPSDAITMKFNAAGYLLAEVSSDKCKLCGLCRRICPSDSSNSIAIDGHDPFHGVCLNAYIGHSTDPVIRQKSQSGGVVTSLLFYLLDQGLIEGAIVNRFCENNKRTEVVCATKKDDILDSAGSYYTQSAVVKSILEKQRKSVAAVVLGCQAQSLSLIRDAYSEFQSVEYKIGLICAGHYSAKYVDDLIKISGANPNNVKKFRFRDKNVGGWPGGVKISTSDHNYVLDKKIRHMLKPLYETPRCLLCFDQMNIHSDLVVGDPWGIKNEKNKIGNSVIITRTEKGQNLIDDAIKHGYIKTSLIGVDEVIRGQTVDCRQKTQFFTALNYWKGREKVVPVNERLFENISYISPSRKELRKIYHRLHYCRKVYRENDHQTVSRIISSKRRRLKLNYRLLWVIKLPMKIWRHVHKRLM